MKNQLIITIIIIIIIIIIQIQIQIQIFIQEQTDITVILKTVQVDNLPYPINFKIMVKDKKISLTLIIRL